MEARGILQGTLKDKGFNCLYWTFPSGLVLLLKVNHKNTLVTTKGKILNENEIVKSRHLRV